VTAPTDSGKTDSGKPDKPAATAVPPRGGKKKPNRPSAGRTDATNRSAGSGRTTTAGGGASAPKAATAKTGSKTSNNRRQAQWQARRRRNMMYSAVAVAAVVVIVGVFIGVKVAGGGSSANSSKVNVGTGPSTKIPPSSVNSALPASASKVINVPIASLAAASKGVTVTSLTGGSSISKQPPLTLNGKPEFLYIGAQYCPYCAAERWAMVAALAKFGTFTNLASTASSPTDVLPNSPTFSFYGASYSSPYLEFLAVETETRLSQPLQNPTAAQLTLWKSLDSNETIPFIDIGNKYLISGATYVSNSISNTGFDSVAAQVGNNSTTVGKGIDQAAGAMIKAICQLTNNQPASVCSAIGA